MPAIDFNANDVAPSTGFDAIPAGKYKAVIEATEEKPTKRGDGSYLQITFVVIEGEYQNRKVWARLNLNNPSDQAVGIARSELSAICRAVNVMHVRDTAQLHDLPLVIRVSNKPDKETGEPRNEIKGYEPVAGTAAAVGPAKPAAGQSLPSKAPWKR